MIRLDESYISVKSLDRAYSEGTLENLIADYVSFGGTLEEIYEQAKHSEIVNESCISNAVKILQEGNLMFNDEEDTDIEEEMATEDDYDDYYLSSKTSVMDESVGEMDVDTMTVQDLLAGSVDNMSEEQMDDEIYFFEGVARELKVKNYDDVVVAVDDGDYNPEWVLSDGVTLNVSGREVKYYPSAKMIVENMNGNIFMYFAKEGDAKKYFKLAHKFLDAEELNEEPFGYDTSIKESARGYYNDDGDFLEESYEPSTLEQALNRLDRITGNKYDLLNTYLDEQLDDSRKSHIVEMLNKDNSAELIHKYLREDKEDALAFIKHSIEGGADSGEITITAPKQLQKALSWLKYNNIPYDTYDVPGGTVITWFMEDAEESMADANKRIAEEVREDLQEAMDYINRYINGEYFTDTHKKFTLKKIEDALEGCRDIFEF